MDGVTIDTLRRGRVTILQPEGGARTSLDPLLLASFLGEAKGRVLDLGCGTGALAFLIAEASLRARVVGIEIQAPLIELGREGARRSRLADRVTIVEGDVRKPGHAIPAASINLRVVCAASAARLICARRSTIARTCCAEP